MRIHNTNRLPSIQSRVLNAIRVGSGENLKGAAVSTLEVTGADGLAMLVETQSENPRGNIPEVKRILNRASYIIGKEGSAMWLFDKRGSQIIDLFFNPESHAILRTCMHYMYHVCARIMFEI